jgi:zeaxanthin glucosyltransferase
MAIIAVLIDGEVAHLRPTLCLSESLTRAGHQVFYLGLASLRQTVERIGYRYRSLFEDLCPETETTASDAVTTSQLLDRLLSGEALGGFFEEVRPDAVVTLTIFSILGLILKYKYNVPVLLVRTHCTEGTRTQVLETVLGSALVQMGGSISHLLGLLESRGRTAHSLGDIVAAALQMPEIVLLPREFATPGAADPLLTYVGVDVAEDIDIPIFDEPWISSENIDPRPLVYCSLGTRPDMRASQSKQFFSNIISAVSSEDNLRLLLSTGGQFATDEFPAAHNVRIHKWVPQLKVLEHSALMIMHGGLGGVRECISRSVPMIVFPVLRDQFCAASAVSRLGIGLRGAFNDCSPRVILDLINEVLGNTEYRMRMSLLKDKTVQANTHRGCEIVELLTRTPMQL